MVDMLIERRRWHADRLRGNVESVHLYSDSSPVTGEELQGMVCDVMRYVGKPRRLVLPGASLFYGNYSAISKGVTLLWACFLVAGPFFPEMDYVLSKVVSITTDFGVEIHTLELPNILKAFLAWHGGMALENVRGLVDHSNRLLCSAPHFGLVPFVGQPHEIHSRKVKEMARSVGGHARACEFLAQQVVAALYEEGVGSRRFAH